MSSPSPTDPRPCNTPVTPVCDPTATILRCNFHQKRSGVAVNCQQILKSMRQVAHSTLLTRSLRAHCALTALSLHSHCDLCVPSLIIAALSLRSHHALRDLAATKATSLRPRYDLATTLLRSHYVPTTFVPRSRGDYRYSHGEEEMHIMMLCGG